MRLSKQVVGMVAVLSVAGAAYANDAYKARHDAMEAVGDGMGTLSAMAKKEKPFDAAVVKTTATKMAADLKAAAAQFPAGSGGGTSRAKAEVWSDAAGFAAMMKDASTALAALQEVKDEAAFGTALRAAGGTCKSCHDKYRLPKQ